MRSEPDVYGPGNPDNPYNPTGVRPGKHGREAGLRFNEGKLRVDLVPAEWYRALAEVMTKGAEKYEPRNWEAGMDWSKCYASLMRHVLAWQEGADLDPETGLHHLAHAAWNALALVTYSSTHPEFDDRYERPRDPSGPEPPEYRLPLDKGDPDPLRTAPPPHNEVDWDKTATEVLDSWKKLPVADCGDPFGHKGHAWGGGYWCEGHAFDRT